MRWTCFYTLFIHEGTEDRAIKQFSKIMQWVGMKVVAGDVTYKNEPNDVYKTLTIKHNKQ